MHDQALVWNTDSQLQVTSLTARLRELAGVGSGMPLHVSDLWGNADPLSVAVVAHHWALDGEELAFETEIRGSAFRFELQPLHDLAGATIGVAGRALELRASDGLNSDALRHAERFAGMGTWHCDLRTDLVTISDGLGSLLGIEPRPYAFNIRTFDHPDERERIARSIAEQESDAYVCDHRVMCAGGRVRTVRERVRTIFDDRGVAIAQLGTLIDISDFKEREAELSELALHDALTRLPNRTSFEERLNAALTRCDRIGRRCAVLFADLDDFKAVNDAYGHDFGDRVLSSVAERLNRHVRSSDTIARLGGDEFVILIDELFSDEAALDAARKILRSLDEPFTVGNRSISVSASIGIATYPRCGASASELLAVADREMYAVKRNGGSGVKLAALREESAVHTDEKEKCQVRFSPEPRHFATLESA